MSNCTCSWPYSNVLKMCQPCADARIQTIYDKYPGLEDFEPDPELDKCCQRDEVAERFGWDAAWDWDYLTFLRGDA